MDLLDFTTIEEARAHTEILEVLVYGGDMRELMLATNTYYYFKSSGDVSIPYGGFDIRDLKLAVYDNLNSGNGFDFRESPPHIIENMMNLMIAYEADANGGNNPAIAANLTNLKLACVATCNNPYQPFKDTTLVQFNNAKGVFSERIVTGNGNTIVITLNEQLPENCSATTWFSEDGFLDENIGRSCRLLTTHSKYKIDLKGINQNRDIYVRIPLEGFDFTVEII